MKDVESNGDSASGASQVHVVLVEPEIPQNTGNIARSCLAVGATLHLIKPYGFFTSDRHLKRAGMDYWHKVPLVEHRDLDSFLNRFGNETLALLSTRGKMPYTEIPVQGPVYLIFGSESRGLPAKLLEDYSGQTYRLPMLPGIRSLNLASSATAVLFDSLRQRGFPHLV